MSKRRMYLLGGAGVLGLLAAVSELPAGAGGLLAGLSAAGAGLRTLSLSGLPGNLCAWCIVYLFSSLPLLLMLWQWRLWRRSGSDWLAGLSALLIFLGLFALVNPTLFQGQGTALLEQFQPLAFWMAALSVLVCWLVLSILKKLGESGFEALGWALSVLLCGCAALLVCSAVHGGASWVLSLSRQVMEGNTAPDVLTQAALGGTVDISSLTTGTVALLGVLAVLDLLPSLLGAAVLLWGADLAEAVRREPFGAETVALCEKTARGCQRVVQWAVGLSVCANLLQLLVLPYVAYTSFSIHLPLFPLVLSAALFLLCRCFQRGQILQEDNDSII